MKIYKILAGANINRIKADEAVAQFAKQYTPNNIWTKPLPNGVTVNIANQKPIKSQVIELARKLKEINKVGVVVVYNNSVKLI